MYYDTNSPIALAPTVGPPNGRNCSSVLQSPLRIISTLPLIGLLGHPTNSRPPNSNMCVAVSVKSM